MEYIFPQAIQIAITVVGVVIGGFITLRSLDLRLGVVEANETNYVRKDVLQPQLDGINHKLESQDAKLDHLLERK